MAEWEEAGAVVRSEIHDRTWFGIIPFTAHIDTPCGPLRLVKKAVVDRAIENGATETRWTKGHGDMWELDAKYGDG